MRSSRVAVAFAVAAPCIVSACGAREGLLDDVYGEPRDAAVLDAFAVPDAGPVGTCTASPSFEIARDDATLAYPRLARAGDRAFLVATRMLGRPEELFALPIDLRGNPRGPIQELGVGKGGTMVGRTLDPSAVGFTLSYTDIDGVMHGAVFDADGLAGAPTPLDWSHDGLRPMLVLTPQLAANGWNPVAPGSLGEGFVQDLASRAVTELRFDGRDPFGVPSAREGSFRVAVHDGQTAISTTHDARGGLQARSSHTIPAMGFPTSISAARVVEGIDDAVVVGGGTVRALQDAIVHVERAAGTHTFFLPNDWLFDLDAAFDPTTGWLAVAAGISHDEGIGRIAMPHVYLFAMARDGTTRELVVAGPIDNRTEIHPAILWTGLADAPFLIVWEDDPTSTFRAALVDCD